jgi:hypothetical protein
MQLITALRKRKIMESKITIAVDFDGTCVTHDFPRIGKDIGAIPVLKKIVEASNKLVLNTMRCNDNRIRVNIEEPLPNAKDYLNDAVDWFKENEVPLYGVNRNPRQVWTTSPKVWADLYIDDAALGIPLLTDTETGKSHVDWTVVELMLANMGLISQSSQNDSMMELFANGDI